MNTTKILNEYIGKNTKIDIYSAQLSELGGADTGLFNFLADKLSEQYGVSIYAKVKANRVTFFACGGFRVFSNIFAPQSSLYTLTSIMVVGIESTLNSAYNMAKALDSEFRFISPGNYSRPELSTDFYGNFKLSSSILTSSFIHYGTTISLEQELIGLFRFIGSNKPVFKKLLSSVGSIQLGKWAVVKMGTQYIKINDTFYDLDSCSMVEDANKINKLEAKLKLCQY